MGWVCSYNNFYIIRSHLIFFIARSPRAPRPRQTEVFLITFSQTHHRRYDSSGRGTGQSHKPLPNTHNTHNTHIHVAGTFRTRNTSKRAAADPRLRPLGLALDVRTVKWRRLWCAGYIARMDTPWRGSGLLMWITKFCHFRDIQAFMMGLINDWDRQKRKV